jgi:hypothetical protein
MKEEQNVGQTKEKAQPSNLKTKLKENSKSIIIFLFLVILVLPDQYNWTDIAYLVILFFIVYLSAYIDEKPIWKGFFYSFLAVAIVAVVAVTTVTLFPQIPYIALIAIVTVTGFGCTYLIGSNPTHTKRR